MNFLLGVLLGLLVSCLLWLGYCWLLARIIATAAFGVEEAWKAKIQRREQPWDPPS